MLSQLYWVSVTYVRRPLFWAAAAILLAVVVYGVSTGNHNKIRSSYPSFQVDGLQLHSYEEFQKLRDEGRLKEVRSFDFTSLLIDKSRHLLRLNETIPVRAIHLDEINIQEFIKECDQATEIEQLVFTSLFPDLDPSWLSQFSKLRHFKTYSMSGKKPWVAQLKKLPELERLSITSCYSLEGLEQLARLEKFHTLEIDSIRQFSDNDLRIISQLPQLRTLILKPHQVATAPKPNEPKNSITDAGLALLRDMPNLKTVYVNPFALERVRSILPNKRVLRSTYSPIRVGNLTRVEFALALFFVVVYFQITGQSSLFLGRIAPRFTPSHWIVPIGILAVAIGLGTLCIATGKSQMLPALAVCLLVVAGMGWSISIVLSAEKKMGMTGFAFALSLGLGPLAVLATHEHYFPSEIDAFLLGDFPRICAVLIGIACLVMALILRHFTQLPLRLAELGKTVPVSLSDIKTSAIANSQQSRQTHWPMKIASGILDRRIACGFHGNQPAQRISLWHAAVSGMGRWQKVALTILFGLLAGGVPFWKRGDPDTFFALALVAPLAVGVFWLFSSSLCWHLRLKHFSHELLRPVSRRSLRSDFFRSLLGDLGASLLLTLPLTCIAYLLLKDVAVEITPWIPTLGWLSLGGLALGMGVFASIALIRRTWLAITAFALIYFLFFMILPFATIVDWEPLPAELFRISLALGLLGVTMFVLAWRRFLQIEWGKHA